MMAEQNVVVLKPVYYDDFKCIADQCTYSCCQDWNIEIEEAVYAKYQMLPAISPDCFYRQGSSVYIQNRQDGRCPFLNENGLCSLILQYDETILSRTCTLFPRTYVKRADGIEASISNSCPALLEMLLKLPAPLSFVLEEDLVPEVVYGCCEEEWIPVRDQMIDLIQIRGVPLWKRLFASYQFANKIETDGGHREHYVKNYTDPNYLNALFQMLDTMTLPLEPRLQLLSRLFLHINGKSQHYLGYKRYIQALLTTAESPDWDTWIAQWGKLREILNEYHAFFENFCVNNIFRDGAVRREQYGLLHKSIAVILEVAMIDFTLFLYWLHKGQPLTEKEVIEIACYYARIIEHNSKNFYEFITELRNEGLLSEADLLLLLG